MHAWYLSWCLADLEWDRAHVEDTSWTFVSAYAASDQEHDCAKPNVSNVGILNGSPFSRRFPSARRCYGAFQLIAR